MARTVLLCLFALATASCQPVSPAAGPVDRAESADRLDVELREVAVGVWVHTSYYTYPDGTRFPANGLIVRDGAELVLVDTAWGEILTLALLDRIDEEIGLPIRLALVTHSHFDRVAGVDALEARGIEVLAHPLTRSRTIAQGTPVPNGTIPGIETPGESARLGIIEVFYPGPGHAPDNLMVWVASAGVLFGGCAVREAATGSLGSVADADVAAWSVGIRAAKERYGEAVVVVPGHGQAGGVELLDHTLELLGRAADD